MIMRYHWSLGVGHTYSYQRTSFEVDDTEDITSHQEENTPTEHVLPQTQKDLAVTESGSPPESDTDDSNGLDGSQVDSDNQLDHGGEDTDSNEELLVMDDMYGD